MSNVRYNTDAMTITVDDAGIAEALGDLRRKTPAVLKVAINATARKGTRDLKRGAIQRYALTDRGEARVKQMRQKKKATNTSLSAEYGTKNDHLPLDYAYFQHTPETVFKGNAVWHAPVHVRARVLRDEAMHELTAGTDPRYGPVSKGFLAEFKSGHIGMIQRDIGSYSANTKTKNDFLRWRSSTGQVEKTVTMSRPSVPQMGAAVWYRGGDEEAAEYLAAAVERRIRQVIDRAARQQRR